MTDAEIREVYNTLTDRRKIEARVFSCVVSAYENNGEIDTGRAAAVLEFVWPGVAMGAVPYEIQGRTADQRNNRNRRKDYDRLMPVIRLFTGQETSSPTTPYLNGSSTPQVPSGSAAAQTGAGFGEPAENKQVEDAAVEAAVKCYEGAGWSVRSVEWDKCGFDLVCTKDAVVEQVEVKGVRGTELCFIITAGEVKQARENPNFVLIVVTSALSPSPTLTKFSGVEFVQRFDLVAIQYRASLKR